MTTEKKFTMSKSLGLLIIALLGAAFFAGTRASGSERPAPEIATAAMVPRTDAFTVEQLRVFTEDMRELRKKLDLATEEVHMLNARLSHLEGACGKICGQ